VIFCGWGEEVATERGATSGEEEEFETLQPHDRTPAIMLIPMVALMVAAAVVGLLPGVVHGAEHAAAHFVDRPSYAAAVLYGGRVRFAEGRTTGLTASDFLYGVGSVVAALALAAVSLFGRALIERVPGPLRSGAGRSLAVLHRLHSGHVGDYIAWLTAGLGALGAVFALALR
jgi:multicomponent Na+:H+ antiporter subunit D